MSDLLNKAITAHGGWERWQRLTRVIVKAKIGGAIWIVKGKAGVLNSVTIKADLHRQHIEYSPFGEGQHSVFDADQTSIVKDDGTIVSTRTAPRKAFQGHSFATPWDDHHLIYFSGYAMWIYLTTPFLLRYLGFYVEEIEPWNENG